MSVKIKQRDITDCGAACLASVASFYKMSIPVVRIRQMAGTDKKGTNILGLVEAATRLGFLAKGVKGDWDSLFKIPKPAIAHVIVRELLHHFVVVTAISGKHIEIMDPADGELHRLAHEEFRKQWTGVLVILIPGEKFSAKNDTISSSLRFWKLVQPNRNILIQTLLGSLLFSILGLSMSFYVGKLIDTVLPGGNLNLLNLLGVTMLIIIILRLLLNFFQSYFILKTGQKIDASLILGYYQHLLKLPQSFFDNMRTGEIISRIGDAVKIRLFVNDVAISLIINIFILIVSFIIMFTFFWKLALIMILVVPFYILIYYLSDKFNSRIQRRVMEKAADLEAHLVESLKSVETIKQLGLEEYSNLKTETRFIALLEVIYRSGLNGLLSGNSTAFISQLITLLVLWFGAGFAIKLEITPGELLSFYTVVGYFTAPVTSIISFNRTLQDAKIASDRLFEIFDLEIEDEKNKVELDRDMIGDIEFENVRFRYGTRKEVFESLNMRISKGEITAITGDSGSGKTTVISLLQKLYPLQSGAIKIGKYELEHISSRSLRKMIAVVPQKINLFAGSVIENIAAGDLSPDMKRIISICEELDISDMISTLPHGFNTHLGENGISLSGGQIQKIAIARAMYRQPEILIFDEATSSLDYSSELSVLKTLEMLRQSGLTVIIIAHRLSVIRLARNVIVLDRGRVVQTGHPEELATKEGPFRAMLKHQNSLKDERVTI